MKSPRLTRFLQRIDDCLTQLVIFGPFLSCGILSILILLSLGVIFTLWRWIIMILAKIFMRGKLGSMVPLRSAPFRTGDSMYKTPTGTVLFYCVLEGKVDVGRFKSVLRKRIFKKVDPKTGKRFYKEGIRNMSLWCGYPFWRAIPGLDMDPTDEQLEKYVLYYKNDPNIKTDFPTMKAFMDRLMYKPYSRVDPLFDAYVFPNYTPDPYANNPISPGEGKEYWALVLHLHHALCDGFTGMKMFGALSIHTPEERVVIPRGENYTHSERMKTASWTTAILETLMLGPRFVFQASTLIYWQFTHSMGMGIWEAEGVEGMNATDVDLTNSEIMEKRARGLKSNFGTTIPLSILSEVKNQAYGGEVSGSAVLYAALVGAVRKTMYTKKWAIPKYLGVSFPLPLPGHDGRLKNHVTGMKVFLPLSESDPAKRVYAIDKSLKSVKTSTLPMFGSFFHVVGGTIPRWIYRVIPLLMKLDRSLTTSNLPGPKEAFDLAGWPVRDIGWSAGASVTLNVLFMSLFSFGGLLRVSFMGPAGLLGHGEEMEKVMVENFFKELEEIRARGPHYCRGVVCEV